MGQLYTTGTVVNEINQRLLKEGFQGNELITASRIHSYIKFLIPPLKKNPKRNSFSYTKNHIDQLYKAWKRIVRKGVRPSRAFGETTT